MSINKLKHIASLTASLLFLHLISAPSYGQTLAPKQHERIKPFTATYDTTWYPLAIKGSASRTLTIKNPNHSLFSFTGKIMTTSLEEKASLQWNDCLPIPRSFSRFKKHLFNKKLIDQQTFNWPANWVTAKHKSRVKKLPINQGTYDPLSYQLALRCDLQRGKTQFEYDVVRKTKIKRYLFKIIGEENINTPLGLLATVKIKRISDGNEKETTLWFSKQHNYTLVKLEQKEANSNHYVFTIRTLTIH